MRVLVTGATGFIGSTVVRELIDAGHQVLGLTRSGEGAESLTAARAEVHRGDLEDLEIWQWRVVCDAVIHCAFRHDWSRFAESCELDKRAIQTIGDVLGGSSRPFFVSSGVGVAHGPRRDRRRSAVVPFPIPSSGLRSDGCRTRGAWSSRLCDATAAGPRQVKQGLVTPLIAIAREKGVSAYVGDGQNRSPAAHVLDVTRLLTRLPWKKALRGPGITPSPKRVSGSKTWLLPSAARLNVPIYFHLKGSGSGAFRLFRVLRGQR